MLRSEHYRLSNQIQEMEILAQASAYMNLHRRSGGVQLPTLPISGGHTAIADLDKNMWKSRVLLATLLGIINVRLVGCSLQAHVLGADRANPNIPFSSFLQYGLAGCLGDKILRAGNVDVGDPKLVRFWPRSTPWLSRPEAAFRNAVKAPGCK